MRKIQPDVLLALRSLYDPGDREDFTCQQCGKVRHATRNSVRAAKWLVYDGTDYGGKPHAIRLCPRCRQSE